MKIMACVLSTLCIIACTSESSGNQNETAAQSVAGSTGTTRANDPAESAMAWAVPRPLINGPWEELSESSNAALIQKLLSVVPEEHHKVVNEMTRFRRMPLPFYPNAFLYEGETKLKWALRRSLHS